MSGSNDDQPSAMPTTTAREPVITPAGSSEEGLSPEISLPLTGGGMSGVLKDSAVTLEFLALSRQRVMKLGHDVAPESPASLPADFANIVDPIVTPAQARWLIEYHEKNISWMHNVLHMAMFREQCEVFLESGTLTSPLWLPLYYTVLSVSSSCISSALTQC
ncbi:C6 transcription factor [Penicillium brevicompactum]|uniref:C6 transcription factor n=1 Tax=Penicillium brevicompactum TaxID=5074 RepID=A0A9W9QPL6_PENBR|nr:C6 transcription factor [Penicillium brevicompactum]